MIQTPQPPLFKYRLDRRMVYVPDPVKSAERAMKKKLTCYNCPDQKRCVYAYDPYNTDGDCLRDK